MRRITRWVKPSDNLHGYDQIVIYGYVTPEKNAYDIGVNGPSLLKRLSRKKGKRFNPTRTQIIKPLKLSYLKLLSGAPTQWIATLTTQQIQAIRYKAKVNLHESVAYPDHINLNEIPKHSCITYRCPYCGDSFTRFKRSSWITHPRHTHLLGDQKVTFRAYPIKIVYAGITLYEFGFKAEESTETYHIKVNDTLPQPHTLKRHYDQIPQYYNNHFEKTLTFNPNRINISTLGYVKPLSEITDYDRLTVITQ